jgi:hypothetical protein
MVNPRMLDFTEGSGAQVRKGKDPEWICLQTLKPKFKGALCVQVRKGKDMERVVQARALRWFMQDRVLVDAASNRTVVFE